MQFDNLPTTPGALLGHRKSGQPIYLIAGGSGEGEGDGGQPTTPPADPAPAPADPARSNPAPAPASKPDDDGRQDPTDKPTDEGLDERTRRTIEAIRGDFKEERARRQAAEAQTKQLADELTEFRNAQKAQMEALAKAFGLKGDDDAPPDPAKLAEELKAERGERDKLAAAVREREVQLAVLQRAGTLDADGSALLDSRSFLQKIKGLDPAADDFADKIGEAITAAIEASPRYKLTAAKPSKPAKPEPTVPKSGGEFNGAPGGNRPWTDEDVARATPDELQTAINQGLLAHMGFGPARKKR